MKFFTPKNTFLLAVFLACLPSQPYGAPVNDVQDLTDLGVGHRRGVSTLAAIIGGKSAKLLPHIDVPDPDPVVVPHPDDPNPADPAPDPE